MVSGIYQLTLKNGEQINFDSYGYQTSIVEPTTNDTFSFAYNGSHQIQWIEDFEVRYYTLFYTDGQITSITDAANRVTQLGYTAGDLISITDPDPGHMEAIPSFHYSYDTPGDLLTLTDPDNNLFTFAYSNTTDRIQTVTRPDTLPGGAHTSESLFVQQLNGVGDPTPVLVAEAGADYTDPRSTQQNPIDWFVNTDWFGYGYGLQYAAP